MGTCREPRGKSRGSLPLEGRGAARRASERGGSRGIKLHLQARQLVTVDAVVGIDARPRQTAHANPPPLSDAVVCSVCSFKELCPSGLAI